MNVTGCHRVFGLSRLQNDGHIAVVGENENYRVGRADSHLQLAAIIVG